MKLSLYALNGDEEELIGTVQDHPLRGDQRVLAIIQEYPASLTLRQIAAQLNHTSRYTYALTDAQDGDPVVVKHLPGQHDQAEHGNWAAAAHPEQVFAQLKDVPEVDYGRGRNMPVDRALYEAAYNHDYGADTPSLEAYKAAGAEFQKMQQELRAGKQPTPEMSRHIEALDRCMLKTTFKHDTVLYRGMNWTRGAPPETRNMTGQTFGDQGFVSASLDRRTAAEYATKIAPEQRAMVVIHAKAGQHVVAMDQFGANEDEFCLPRGTWFKVIKDSYDPRAKDPHRMRVLEVEIVQ